MPFDSNAFNAHMVQLHADKRIPGLATAVVADGETIFARGYGHADLAQQRPVTPDTPFIVASLTKPLAATCLLRLVEQGSLDLETPISAWVPEYDALCQRIQKMAQENGPLVHLFRDYRCQGQSPTLRHHLTHTAQGVPGTRFTYNGFLYGLPGRGLSQRFPTLLETHLAQPLGLAHSTTRHNDTLHKPLPHAPARTYRLQGSQVIPVAWPKCNAQRGFGAGVVSSVNDLARFDSALDADKLLQPHSKALMWTPTRLASGETAPYGIGWFVQQSAFGQLIWHSGWWPDASSALYLKVPQKGLTLLLLANSEGIWWNNPLNGGDVLPSAFAQAFLSAIQ